MDVRGKLRVDGGYNYAVATGSSNAYAATIGLGGIVAGVMVWIKANHTNTGAATLNVDGTGAVAVKKLNDQDLASGDIENNQIFGAIYDGTVWQMLSHLGNAPAGGGGGAALTSNAGDAVWYPWGHPRLPTQFTLTNGTTKLIAFTNPVQAQFRRTAMHVVTASGAGKGGVCSVYTRASNGDLTRIALSAGFLVDSAGWKFPAWASGSAVSAGVLTLPAGQNLYWAFTVDADAGTGVTVGTYTMDDGFPLVVNEFDGSAFQRKVIARQDSGSTGSGTSVTSAASITNANVIAENQYVMKFGFHA